MCNWCVAKDAIYKVMKKLKIKSKDLQIEIESWECDDTDSERDDEEVEEKLEKSMVDLKKELSK